MRVPTLDLAACCASADGHRSPAGRGGPGGARCRAAGASAVLRSRPRPGAERFRGGRRRSRPAAPVRRRARQRAAADRAGLQPGERRVAPDRRFAGGSHHLPGEARLADAEGAGQPDDRLREPLREELFDLRPGHPFRRPREHLGVAPGGNGDRARMDRREGNQAAAAEGEIAARLDRPGAFQVMGGVGREQHLAAFDRRSPLSDFVEQRLRQQVDLLAHRGRGRSDEQAGGAGRAAGARAGENGTGQRDGAIEDGGVAGERQEQPPPRPGGKDAGDFATALCRRSAAALSFSGQRCSRAAGRTRSIGSGGGTVACRRGGSRGEERERRHRAVGRTESTPFERKSGRSREGPAAGKFPCACRVTAARPRPTT